MFSLHMYANRIFLIPLQAFTIKNIFVKKAYMNICICKSVTRDLQHTFKYTISQIHIIVYISLVFVFCFVFQQASIIHFIFCWTLTQQLICNEFNGLWTTLRLFIFLLTQIARLTSVS